MSKVIHLLEKWQKDGMTGSGVYVKYYSLEPQATGFMLTLQIFDATNNNPEIPTEETYLFAPTLNELFDIAEKKIADVRQSAIASLKEDKQ